MNKITFALFLSLALAGCANSPSDGQVSGSPQSNKQTRHFDFNAAVADINAGKASIGNKDYDSAIRSLKKGLALWPAHQPGWADLSQAYDMKGDVNGANYAGYFAERIEWANSLNGSTAATAFDNVALINAEKPFADTRIPQTAALLSAFYRQEQARIINAKVKSPRTVGQKYQFYPAAIVSGGVLLYQLVRMGSSN